MSFTSSALIGAAPVMQYQQGQKALKLQKEAMDQAEQRARAAADKADQAYNKANAKTPDIAAMFGANKAGLSSTMLTGPTGIDTSALLLGRTTLLGG